MINVLVSFRHELESVETTKIIRGISATENPWL